MVIREATPDDLEAIVELCALHAQYEKAEYEKEGKIDLLAEYLFGEVKAVHCFLVELEEEIVGYATVMQQFSTWDAAFYLYLDCLYFKEKVRGYGYGGKMMEYIRKYALKQGLSIIQWQTPVFNESAIRFYNRLGAVSNAKQRYGWDC